MKKLLTIIFFFVSLTTFAQSGYFTYTLPIDASTSVGVYNSSGVLIRQIWSNKSETAGAKSAWWDGLDQLGATASGSPFSVQVEYFNITPTWDGIMINTETTQTGTNSLSGFYARGVDGYSGVQVGPIIYWVGGYGEGHPSEFKTPNNNINSRINTVGPTMDCVLEYVASDSTNVYIGGYDAFATGNTFVYAHTVSTEAAVSFSAGTNYKPVLGVTQSMIAYKSSGALSSNQITGLAVQKTHNYIFVCRKGINEVQVVLKTTGATVQTITTITGPSACAVDGSDNVWISDATNIKQYSVNAGTGALTATGVTAALTNVRALAVSPNGSTIAAADVANQVVHAYATSNGASKWTIGTGDYRSNSTVANNKFYWLDSTQNYPTFIAYLSDSSILIGDRMNGRVQHFANDHATYSESQYMEASTYNVYIDPKNQSRVFNNYREYSIDYTQPVQSAWTLTHNWGGSLTSGYTNFQEGLKNPATFSNGRTYCFLRNADYELVELISGGNLRKTGIHKTSGSGQSYVVDSLGSLIVCSRGVGGIGTSVTYSTYQDSTFDGSNNPIWKVNPTTVETVPNVTNTNARGGVLGSSINTTTNGNFVFFDINKPSTLTGGSNGFKLGAIPLGGSTYAYQNLPSTTDSFYEGPFPGQMISPQNGGYFDNYNHINFGGGVFGVNGNWIVCGYHGEGWKGTQTNYYYLFDDRTGLFLKNFGSSWYLYPNTPSAPQFAVAQTGGNALLGALAKGTDGNYYLVHGDEIIHCGLHRWSFPGLSSATILTASFTPGGSPPVIPGTDLLAGLTRPTTNLPNNTGGWVRSPASDYSDATGHTTSYVGKTSYDISQSPDLYVTNNIVGGSIDHSFSYRLIANGQRSSSWQQNFDMLWDVSANLHQSAPYNNGNFIEMVDSTGKIICEVHYGGTGSNTNYLTFNGVDVATDSAGASVYRLEKTYQTVSWVYLSGTLTITLSSNTNNTPTSISYSTNTPFQAGADMSQPYNFRLHYFVNTNLGGGSSFGYGVGIYNANFVQNFLPSSCNCHSRSGTIKTVNK